MKPNFIKRYWAFNSPISKKSIKKEEKMSLDLAIVIGSTTDLPVMEESKMSDVLDRCGISWELSIISADRNPEVLTDYCNQAKQSGVRVFIAGAGMAARLPGAIAAQLKYLLPVIGVALPSEEFPNALDALLSITRTPSGCPVIFAGIGKTGFRNAAIIAAQIIANGEDEKSRKIREGLTVYFLKTKKAQIGYKKSLRKEE
jgi:phosphoribosylaminoimidazole carboxylase PurE protein